MTTTIQCIHCEGGANQFPDGGRCNLCRGEENFTTPYAKERIDWFESPTGVTSREKPGTLTALHYLWVKSVYTELKAADDFEKASSDLSAARIKRADLERAVSAARIKKAEVKLAEKDAVLAVADNKHSIWHVTRIFP